MGRKDGDHFLPFPGIWGAGVSLKRHSQGPLKTYSSNSRKCFQIFLVHGRTKNIEEESTWRKTDEKLGCSDFKKNYPQINSANICSIVKVLPSRKFSTDSRHSPWYYIFLLECSTSKSAVYQVNRSLAIKHQTLSTGLCHLSSMGVAPLWGAPRWLRWSSMWLLLFFFFF